MTNMTTIMTTTMITIMMEMIKKYITFTYLILNEIKGGKANRGEKKFKKAMTKMGMKPVTGINRVTIKKSKDVFLLTYKHNNMFSLDPFIY